MPVPRVSSETATYLREMNLTLWLCMHPMRYAVGERPKMDKTRVEVQLAGPGIKVSPWGSGATTAEAVDSAMKDVFLRSHFPGLTGALARLEMELGKLDLALIKNRFDIHGTIKTDHTGLNYIHMGDIDDDVPF